MLKFANEFLLPKPNVNQEQFDPEASNLSPTLRGGGGGLRGPGAQREGVWSDLAKPFGLSESLFFSGSQNGLVTTQVFCFCRSVFLGVKPKRSSMLKTRPGPGLLEDFGMLPDREPESLEAPKR